MPCTDAGVAFVSGVQYVMSIKGMVAVSWILRMSVRHIKSEE
jgi:hypothetical protein